MLRIKAVRDRVVVLILLENLDFNLNVSLIVLSDELVGHLADHLIDLRYGVVENDIMPGTGHLEQKIDLLAVILRRCAAGHERHRCRQRGSAKHGNRFS